METDEELVSGDDWEDQFDVIEEYESTMVGSSLSVWSCWWEM